VNGEEVVAKVIRAMNKFKDTYFYVLNQFWEVFKATHVLNIFQTVDNI
jgi:hypothetical protein